MTTEQKILSAIEEEKRAGKALDSAKLRTRELYMKFFEETYGVSIGCLVKDSKGSIYRVSEINVFSGTSRPWLEGNPKKKNGFFGSAERHVYGDWEVVK